LRRKALSSRGKVRSPRFRVEKHCFQRMFTRIGCEGRPPHFHVSFTLYSSLVIDTCGDGAIFYVRFSDLLQRAPQACWKERRPFARAGVSCVGLRGRWWSRTWICAVGPDSQIGSIIYAGGRCSPCAGFARGESITICVAIFEKN